MPGYNAGFPPKQYPNLSSYGANGFFPYVNGPEGTIMMTGVDFLTGSINLSPADAIKNAINEAQIQTEALNGGGLQPSIFVFYIDVRLDNSSVGYVATIGYCFGPGDLVGGGNGAKGSKYLPTW